VADALKIVVLNTRTSSASGGPGKKITMVYHIKLPWFFGYGNTTWYTMVWFYHGIPYGITIPKIPWYVCTMVQTYHGMPYIMWYAYYHIQNTMVIFSWYTVVWSCCNTTWWYHRILWKNYQGFYQRVSIASYASAGIARVGMSVCLSVRHTPVLYQNEESSVIISSPSESPNILVSKNIRIIMHKTRSPRSHLQKFPK